MMPHAVPSASVSMYIPHVGGGLEQVSEIVHCWFSGRTVQNYSGLASLLLFP